MRPGHSNWNTIVAAARVETEAIRRADVEAVGGPTPEALILPEVIAFSTSNSLIFLSTGCADDMKLAGDIQGEDTDEAEE
jgi:hypothetical protein